MENNNIELLKKLKCEDRDIYISKNITLKSETITLGDHIAIDDYLYCTSNLYIKNYVHISSHVSIIGGKESNTYIGNFVNISTGTKILSGSSDFLNEGLISLPVLPKHLQKNIYNPIKINDFVTIGANCTILTGIELGEGSIIAAGSVVTKNTEPWTLYKGVPAKKYKQIPKEKKIQDAISLGYLPIIKIFKVLLWNHDSYFICNPGGCWFPNTEFIHKNTKFIFTNDKSLFDECHIVLFGIHSDNNLKNVNYFINLLKTLKKPSFQKWFTLSSECRFIFSNNEVSTLLDAGIDKILQQDYCGLNCNAIPDGLIQRGHSREYLGIDGMNNYGPNIFFKYPVSYEKKNKMFVMYCHAGVFNNYGNVNNIPYNFPYKSRGEYISEIMSVFPCDSFGRYNNNIGGLIDNHYNDANCWNNKLKISSNYKFTCAIENCLEEVYTEKIFQAYLVSSIPIVSIKNNFNILPKKSYISIHDFSTATELGNYLHKVANNKELYESYFDWKKKPETFKSDYPQFYNMIVSSQNPYFLENLYNDQDIAVCDEESMNNYNIYYKKYYKN